MLAGPDTPHKPQASQRAVSTGPSKQPGGSQCNSGEAARTASTATSAQPSTPQQLPAGPPSVPLDSQVVPTSEPRARDSDIAVPGAARPGPQLQGEAPAGSLAGSSSRGAHVNDAGRGVSGLTGGNDEPRKGEVRGREGTATPSRSQDGGTTGGPKTGQRSRRTSAEEIEVPLGAAASQKPERPNTVRELDSRGTGQSAPGPGAVQPSQQLCIAQNGLRSAASAPVGAVAARPPKSISDGPSRLEPPEGDPAQIGYPLEGSGIPRRSVSAPEEAVASAGPPPGWVTFSELLLETRLFWLSA
jgi:hypothetical protein